LVDSAPRPVSLAAGRRVAALPQSIFAFHPGVDRQRQRAPAYVARDRDKYEKELVLARKRLEQLVAEANQVQEDAKDRAAFAEQLVGIVSHDLRNPLSSILLGASLLERSELSVAQRNGIARITRAGERANRLIGPPRLHPGAPGQRARDLASADRPARHRRRRRR
jgi:signal transduction histidine kinase